MTQSTDWMAAPQTADGHYAAIADVHGCRDLLARAFDRLDADLPSGGQIVLLGDLIDRGPDSLGALDLAIAGCGGRKVHALAGNHESMLCSALFEPHPDHKFGGAFFWMRNGGDTVLGELDARGLPCGAELEALFGQKRVDFLKSMLPHHRAGQVLFAHAGLDPEVSLAAQLAQPVMDFGPLADGAQDRTSMRWIREPWVGFNRPLSTTPIGEDLFVIYGHTIQKGVLLTPCQAGTDLGSFSTGMLCVTEIDHDRMRFHFVGPQPELLDLPEL